LEKDAKDFIAATEDQLQKVAAKYGKSISARLAVTGRTELIQEMRNHKGQ